MHSPFYFWVRIERSFTVLFGFPGFSVQSVPGSYQIRVCLQLDNQ